LCCIYLRPDTENAEIRSSLDGFVPSNPSPSRTILKRKSEASDKYCEYCRNNPAIALILKKTLFSFCSNCYVKCVVFKQETMFHNLSLDHRPIKVTANPVLGVT